MLHIRGHVSAGRHDILFLQGKHDVFKQVANFDAFTCIIKSC